MDERPVIYLSINYLSYLMVLKASVLLLSRLRRLSVIRHISPVTCPSSLCHLFAPRHPFTCAPQREGHLSTQHPRSRSRVSRGMLSPELLKRPCMSTSPPLLLHSHAPLRILFPFSISISSMLLLFAAAVFLFVVFFFLLSFPVPHFHSTAPSPYMSVPPFPRLLSPFTLSLCYFVQVLSFLSICFLFLFLLSFAVYFLPRFHSLIFTLQFFQFISSMSSAPLFHLISTLRFYLFIFSLLQFPSSTFPGLLSVFCSFSFHLPLQLQSTHPFLYFCSFLFLHVSTIPLPPLPSPLYFLHYFRVSTGGHQSHFSFVSFPSCTLSCFSYSSPL